MKIYIHNHSQENEELFQMKCLRKDVFVETDQGIYNLFFISAERLTEEIKTLISVNGYYIPENNLIAVDLVDQASIIRKCVEIGEKGINTFIPCVQQDVIILLNLSENEKNEYVNSHWDIFVNKNDLKF